MSAKIKHVEFVTVECFHEKYAKKLDLKPKSGTNGYDRLIGEPAMNRPGLALAGYVDYFATKRIQVFGNSEISYLGQLDIVTRKQRFENICLQGIPCIVIARDQNLPEGLDEVAMQYGIPVFGTDQVTMQFLNQATICLEEEFAPSVSMHGCMVDMHGVGILIVGKSGAGKSETAIGLLERGASLVADDVVRIHSVGGNLVASAPDISRGYMEIRGIGIVNVANLYGLAAIRPRKNLNMVVTLKPYADLNEVDRVGIQSLTYRIIDQDVAHVEIPVAPARDTSRMVTIAALDQQLRLLGYNMADEFNKRLLDHMAKNTVRRPQSGGL